MNGVDKRPKGSVGICIRLKDAEAIKRDAKRKGMSHTDLLRTYISLGRTAYEEGVVDVGQLVTRLHSNIEELSELLQVAGDQISCLREDSQKSQEAFYRHIVELLMIVRLFAHKTDRSLLQDAQANARRILQQAAAAPAADDSADTASVGG